MGLLGYNEVTYYYHQRHFLFPSIVMYWRSYQKKLLESLKGKEVVLAGDGRHDSMGHSAKYCTYTMFCCTIGLIIHLVVIQANQAGSSTAMEAIGHQKALYFPLSTSMVITTFVSDRHATIAKWMREICPKVCKQARKPVIKHFYDLWHIGKSIQDFNNFSWRSRNILLVFSKGKIFYNYFVEIQKVLITLAKEKDCEVLGKWRKACVRHFYWAATSTLSGIGEVKWAKFESFFWHIINKHKDFANTIYNKCSHSDILKPRVWLTKGNVKFILRTLGKGNCTHSIILINCISQYIGSIAYEKLVDALTKKRLVNSIKQASPVAQTSCLEGYHSVINQFAPKKTHFSYPGMLCRSILAALHFNFNLRRDNKKDKDGQTRLRVVYAKYKEGEGTVRNVRVKQDFSYVEQIYDTMVNTPRKELEKLEKELKKEIPKPLHSMLAEKQAKDEAINLYRSRKRKINKDCPPTCTDQELQVFLNKKSKGQAGQQPTKRKPPTCKTCGDPMKGHKKENCCANNSE